MNRAGNSIQKTDKIFVAGHRGLVGSAIVRRLRELGYGNLVLKARLELDLTSQADVRRFFEGERPDGVILSAAKVGGIAANSSAPADFLFENLEIQNNVIWHAHLSGVKKLVFLGSSCIYPRDCHQPMKEEYLLQGRLEPTNEGYAIAKIAGLKLCAMIFEQFGQKFISCMPTNTYGPGDNFSVQSSHVVSALMRRMHEAKLQDAQEVVIWGTGESRREFLHVDDLAAAIVFLLERYEQKDFVNVGTGVDVSIRHLAHVVRKVVGYDGELTFDATKPDGMPKKLLDVSKLSDLGWRSTISFTDGLKTTYEWFLENVDMVRS